MIHSIKLLPWALLGLCGACATHNEPPAASSQSVEAATNTPSSQPNFAPASADGTAAATADRRDAPLERSIAPNADGSPSNAKTIDNSAARVPAPDMSTPSTTAPSTMADTDSATRAGATAPDNTRVNARDRDSSKLVPTDQGNNQQDLDVTQKIRQAVMKDSSLSFTAKNVKIITVNGKVTLRGPVKTDAERASIEAAARRVAGGQVDNQIEVKK